MRNALFPPHPRKFSITFPESERQNLRKKYEIFVGCVACILKVLKFSSSEFSNGIHDLLSVTASLKAEKRNRGDYLVDSTNLQQDAFAGACGERR